MLSPWCHPGVTPGKPNPTEPGSHWDDAVLGMQLVLNPPVLGPSGIVLWHQNGAEPGVLHPPAPGLGCPSSHMDMVAHGHSGTRTQWHMDMAAHRYGGTRTWWHTDMVARRHGGTWILRHTDMVAHGHSGQAKAALSLPASAGFGAGIGGGTGVGDRLGGCSGALVVHRGLTQHNRGCGVGNGGQTCTPVTNTPFPQ